MEDPQRLSNVSNISNPWSTISPIADQYENFKTSLAREKRIKRILKKNGNISITPINYVSFNPKNYLKFIIINAYRVEPTILFPKIKR